MPPPGCGTRWVQGDFDGNGLADYACLYDTGFSGAEVWVFQSTGSGFVTRSWRSYPDGDLFASSCDGRFLAGDFDGDGKTDLVCGYDYGHASMRLIVLRSEGSSFREESWWYAGPGGFSAAACAGRFVAGDFSGDGRTDLLCGYDAGGSTLELVAFVSTGDAFSKQSWWSSGAGNFNPAACQGRFLAGNFDGDAEGKADVVCGYDYGNSTMRLITFVSRGNEFDEQWWWYSGAGNFNPAACQGRFLAGNLDGDAGGKTDLVCGYDYGRSTMRLIAWVPGDGAFDEQWWWYSGKGGFDANGCTGRLFAGDSTGDLRSDLTCAFDHGDGAVALRVFVAGARAFAAPARWCSALPSSDVCVDAASGHVSVLSAYHMARESTAVSYDYSGQLAGALTAGQIELIGCTVPSSWPDGQDIKVDLGIASCLLRNGANGEPEPRPEEDAKLQLTRLRDSLESAHRLDQVASLHLYDEPYQCKDGSDPNVCKGDGSACEVYYPRSVLERWVSYAHDVFGADLPTFIVFAGRSFAPDRCGTPPDDRGIPAGLDWASFDVYQRFDPLIPEYLAVLKVATAHTGTRILLSAEAYAGPWGHLLDDGEEGVEERMIASVHRYFGLARAVRSVIGVDHYTWRLLGKEEGLAAPAHSRARATVRAFGLQVRRAQGMTAPAVVPVFEWQVGPTGTCSESFQYRAWYWDGWEPRGLIPLGVAFGLEPEGTPRTQALYRCSVSRNVSGCEYVDHVLTTDPSCGGSLLAQERWTLGGINTDALPPPGTATLHEFTNSAGAHAYSTEASHGPGWHETATVGNVIPYTGI